MPVPRIDDLRPLDRSAVRRRAWRSRWCFVRGLLRHFRWRFLIIGVILLGGAVLFRTLEPEKEHTLARAVYYTFSLIFGETPEEFPTAPGLQAVFFIVPILGLTVIIEAIIDFALILRDRRRFERSWCIMLAESMKNHIVLIGLGRLGFRTWTILRRLGKDIVVIERDADNQFLDELRRAGSPFLIGDARRDALLQDANVARARSIILATDDDMANLEAALDARRINPQIRVVLRMFDQNMANKVRDGFNIELAISQSAMSAPTFASCALSPATVNSFIVGDELVAMQRWLVRRGGPLCGLTIGDVMRRHALTAVQYTAPGSDGQGTLCPAPELELEPGAGLVLQGPITTLDALRADAAELLTDVG